ncbi:MAG: hypothetical protein H6981_01800 [Gammaproteobacteria bacterium]|nr:hypothetical protein [Gammaproteobacteria bacterium]MCP5135522.1 hypothetical protein [Gammaproteobacteria bacterium]
MSGRYIELPHAEVTSVEDQFGTVRLRLGDLTLLKSEGIPGVNESTRWRNAATIEFEEAEVEGELPELPARIATGDITLNGMTYRDMIALPLDQTGYASIELKLETGRQLTITGNDHIRLTLDGPGKYLEHVVETLGK